MSASADAGGLVGETPTLPAWLSMRPNFRVEESSRLAIEAMRECERRFPHQDLRARLDSVRRVHGIAPAETRSHPEAARRLDELLERQRRRQDCTTSSPEYLRSREIVEGAPHEFELSSYVAADAASEHVGTIRIRMDTEGMGPEVLTFGFRSAEGEEIDWETDRMPTDGYGGYYHTALERRGDWVLLPADPFPTPVWIDWRASFHSPPQMEPILDEVYMLRSVEADIVGLEAPPSWDAPGVVYLRHDGERVWFRLEGPDDGPCPGSQSPEYPDGSGGDVESVYSLGPEDLVDDRGHLLIRVKYARGC